MLWAYRSSFVFFNQNGREGERKGRRKNKGWWMDVEMVYEYFRRHTYFQ